jgi:TolB-like protein
MKKSVYLCIALLIASLSSLPASAQSNSKSVNIALVSIKNLDTSPQFDYLSGIIQAILLFDFTKTPGITIVDRGSLDRVFSEQQLQSSGIVSNPDNAAKIGKLLGVHFFCSAEYVALGSEVMVTLKFISADTGKVSVFSERGRTENIIHLIAEKSVQFLTGKPAEFRSNISDRSLITFKDEAPGSIALHSSIVHAEIFLDNEFAGYTKGNSETPSEFTNLKPGKHTIRVHLGKAWGVIVKPSFTFRDWEETIDVQPAKRHVIKDLTHDFNGQIYDAMNLFSASYRLSDETKEKVKQKIKVTFTDRDGKNIEITVLLNPNFSGKISEFSPVVTYNGVTEKIANISPEAGKDNTFDFAKGKVTFSLKLDTRYNPFSFSFDILRTDIWQNMYDDEVKK